MIFSQFIISSKNSLTLPRISIIAIALTSWFSSAYADETNLKVVTSIKPIHSLVANVMKGTGTPALLIKGASSPHGFSLKPSQSRTLQNADLIFWVGPTLEASLQKPIASIGENAVSIELEEILEEEHHLNADVHNDDHKEDHEEVGHDAHEKHENHNEHKHNANAHIWLNPDNAKLIIHEISHELGKADPKNAEIFERNANETILKIDALISEMKNTLAPIKKDGYILFHDAYKPFEQHFGFQSSGIISINPEVKPSAAQIRKLQNIIEQHNVACVFSEPQFGTKTTSLITQGSDVKIGTLDPLGFQISNGADLYFTLMKDISNAFAKCIGNKK